MNVIIKLVKTKQSDRNTGKTRSTMKSINISARGRGARRGGIGIRNRDFGSWGVKETQSLSINHGRRDTGDFDHCGYIFRGIQRRRDSGDSGPGMSSKSFNVVSIPSAIAVDDEDEDDSDDGPSSASSSNGEGEKEKDVAAATTITTIGDGDPSDIQSFSFDPQRALLDNNFDLSFAAGVDPVDNVEKLATVLGGTEEKHKTEARGKNEKKAEVGPSTRRFEENQMPIKGKVKRPRNVLHFMKKCRDQGCLLMERSSFFLTIC